MLHLIRRPVNRDTVQHDCNSYICTSRYSSKWVTGERIERCKLIFEPVLMQTRHLDAT